MEYEIEFRIFFYIKYNFFLNVRLVIFLVDYMFKGGKLEILCIYGIKFKNVGLKFDIFINCYFFFS